MSRKPSKAAEEEALHRHLKATLRHFRESKGWSQAYMGKLLGLSKASYEKYEGDNPEKKPRKIPLTVLIDFCEISGFSLDTMTRSQLRKRA